MYVRTFFLLMVFPIFSFGQNLTNPVATRIKPVAFGHSAPLRDIAPLPLCEKSSGKPEFDQGHFTIGYKTQQIPENQYVFQNFTGKETLSLLQTFDGLNSGGVSPNPDTQGDVGPDNYFQMVKYTFAIWDKEGILLYGPANNKTLWASLPGPWNSLNYYTDPIVLYDHLSDRWLVSCMVYDIPNTYFEMIAISQTPDPLGAWNLYAYEFNNMPDYPKFGVWPDGYYMTINEYYIDANSTGHWEGLTVMVFNREDMINGVPAAKTVKFHFEPTSPNIWEDPSCFLPCDLDGPSPPTGTPNYLASVKNQFMGYPEDQLLIWSCHINWEDTTQCFLTEDAVLPVDPFICYPGDQNHIQQPGSINPLFSMNDRLMMRLQYRNFSTHQSLVTNHTVDANGNYHFGMRWYELRNSGNGWTIHQQGTYAPGNDNRWMGSAAMDGNGNIAVGYSVSGDSTYPSIRVTGRRQSDNPGYLTFGETEVMTGAGVQATNTRWGDYSMMGLDPGDDLTFWYTQQYIQLSGLNTWKTRILSFQIDTLHVATPMILETQMELLLYPNPVTHFMNVSIKTDHTEQISIMIYNLFMCPVKTILADVNLPAGEYRFVWDRTNQQGQFLPHGIYLCECRTGTERITKKIILD